MAALLLASASLACSRPIDRPREGAQPVPSGPRATPTIDTPPTLAVPGSPAPGVPIVIAVSPTPSPSPGTGRPPIISALQPAADAVVPPGQVTLGARVAGSVELVEVNLSLDGAPLQPQLSQQDARTWTVSLARPFDAPAKHTLRISARDREGKVGGFTWSFEVAAPGPTPRPSPSPRAAR